MHTVHEKKLSHSDLGTSNFIRRSLKKETSEPKTTEKAVCVFTDSLPSLSSSPRYVSFAPLLLESPAPLPITKSPVENGVVVNVTDSIKIPGGSDLKEVSKRPRQSGQRTLLMEEKKESKEPTAQDEDPDPIFAFEKSPVPSHRKEMRPISPFNLDGISERLSPEESPKALDEKLQKLFADASPQCGYIDLSSQYPHGRAYLESSGDLRHFPKGGSRKNGEAYEGKSLFGSEPS